MSLGILTFRPQFMERLWGGAKLQDYLRNAPAQNNRTGEAWLIADHASCTSVVAEGANAGTSLRELMTTSGEALLGTEVAPTPTGRFPLLLKLIDADTVLSVQVHPDDTQAKQLGESDLGKTEMWHVLHADPESTLTSGLCNEVTHDLFETALRQGGVAPLLRSFPVTHGDSVFVSPGTIHAIGAGVLLAEIQQNSDITYRLFDWDRVDAQGTPRELHVDKALTVMDFSATHGGRVAPLRYCEAGVLRERLAACRYFATDKVHVRGSASLSTGFSSFHIVLSLDHRLTVTTDDNTVTLYQGEAALIPGATGDWHVAGEGTFLDYYVPNLHRDVVLPLRRHGYTDAQITQLSATSGKGDLYHTLRAHSH